MAFKPVIIDTGVFKQLPSGQPLDAGGWNLPTTGGTLNYALIADASGHAVWAQPDHGDLAGLGDDDHPQYVRNNGETSNVDLGSQTLTTTGTVVGSNIPAPTASNQILQASAANVAVWSTDVTSLTSLTVDNIAIDGNTILSTTGTVDFGDDHITTTGSITADHIHIDGALDTVDYVQFDLTYVDGTAEGRLQWNIDDGTLEVGMPGGNVNLQIGQEMLVRCRNVTGTLIANGSAVYVTGAQGNRPTIALADASNFMTAGAIGLTTESIAHNANGYVTTAGLVRDVNTNAWAEGSLLWLDPLTPGWYTAAMPDAPYSRVAIGFVLRQHSSEGIIATNPTIVPRIENASGVKAEANSDGDFLRWDAANSWWDRQGDDSIDHGNLTGIEDDDHPQYTKKTGWAANYAASLLTTTTVTSGSRTVSIAPTGASFEFWVQGIKYTKTTTQSVVIDDTEGIWFIYFNDSGVLEASQTVWDIHADDWAGVCIVYWDATNDMFSLNGPEHHTYEMDGATHHYLHHTFGTRWSEGLGVTISGDYLDVTSGKIHDEDIEIWIKDVVGGAGLWSQDLSPAEMPIFYRSGTSAWRLIAPSTTPLYIDTNIPQVNIDSGGGVWVWDNVGVNQYFVYWVVASNDQDTPVITIPGQESSGTLVGARDGNQLADMNFGDLPVVEAKVVARVIIQRKVASPYYDLIEVDDYRNIVDEPSGGGSIVGDHGNLTGLGDNDHPQYLVYSGAVANLDMGSYTVTTTGTVVGSNIPSPALAAKVLTSTGVGTATWQDPTGGGVTDHGALTGLGDDDHTQYVTYSGASGTVNLGAQELTTTSRVVGSNIPAPTVTAKVLTSTGANTATWQDPTGGVSDHGALTGLLDDDHTQYVTYSGASGTVDLGAETLTTTSTVVGSNIPSPTVTDKVLTSTGSGTATWQDATGGVTDHGALTGLSDDDHPQYVTYTGATGTVDLGAQVLTTTGAVNGKNIPSPASTGQILVANGVGTAAWQTTLTTLTYLTVDNITIDNFYIISATGTINFWDDHLLTTGNVNGAAITASGTVTGSMIQSKITTGGVFRAFRDDVSLTGGDVVGSFEYYTNDSSTNSSGICGAIRYQADGAGWFDGTHEGHLGFFTQDETASVGTLIERMTIDNLGAVSIIGGDLTLTTGVIVAANIPSPTADDQALTSSAAGVASWNVTCLADVLAQEVPSASGAERKFVLTADSASQFEIEAAPWTIQLSADETIYVRTTGNDTTGDGSVGAPFLTLARAIEFVGTLYIGDYVIIVDIGEGVFTEAGTLSFQHPFGSQVVWRGVSEQITSQDTDSISASGVSLAHSNLYYYEVDFILPVGKSVSVGDYIAVREVSGGTLPQALYGCHYVSGWVGGSRTATVQVVYRNNAPKASGTVTCTIELIKTVIAFDNKNGLKTSGPYHVGTWEGLVIQGNYDTTNTSAKYGVWLLNTPVISMGGSSATGKALGVVGFQTGIYSQNNAMAFADYAFVSKCGVRCCNAQNGGILNLRYARLSGAGQNGLFAFNGSTVAAQEIAVVGVGNDSVLSYQGSFIDAGSSYIDQNNATNAFTADRWSGLDATSATYSDAINPATGGNNDGSYVIT